VGSFVTFSQASVGSFVRFSMLSVGSFGAFASSTASTSQLATGNGLLTTDKLTTNHQWVRSRGLAELRWLRS
jgi:hypothetical protein